MGVTLKVSANGEVNTVVVSSPTVLKKKKKERRKKGNLSLWLDVTASTPPETKYKTTQGLDTLSPFGFMMTNKGEKKKNSSAQI